MKAIAYMSNTATPLALLNVGASFHLSDAIRKFRPAMVASTIKLVILPAVFFPAALYLGFRQSELVAILIMLGSPTTLSAISWQKIWEMMKSSPPMQLYCPPCFLLSP